MSFDALNQYGLCGYWSSSIADRNQSAAKGGNPFPQKLVEDGFSMFQFSIYMRNCPSRENAEVHVKRVKLNLPEYGHVGVLTITENSLG
jgi:CRISPR-associated endonuclease Cas2